MDRGAWLATVHGIPKESDATEQLRAQAQIHAQECDCWIIW